MLSSFGASKCIFEKQKDEVNEIDYSPYSAERMLK